jgi:hypothetical protein
MVIALLSSYADMLVPHRKPTYGPPQPFTGIALLFYVYMMFASLEN